MRTQWNPKYRCSRCEQITTKLGKCEECLMSEAEAKNDLITGR